MFLRDLEICGALLTNICQDCNFIKMARKYDRYGRNRQFRRNPTQSRKFFPYLLPFQNDFRLNPDDKPDVLLQPPMKFKDKRDRDIVDEYIQSLEHIRKMQKKGMAISSWGLTVPIKMEMAITQGTKNYDKLSKAYRYVADNYGQSGTFSTYH